MRIIKLLKNSKGIICWLLLILFLFKMCFFIKEVRTRHGLANRFDNVEKLVDKICKSSKEQNKKLGLLANVATNVAKHMNKQINLTEKKDFIPYDVPKQSKGLLVNVDSPDERSNGMTFNIYAYKNIISPKISCNQVKVSFLIFVHSNAIKKERRESIRITWGSVVQNYGGKLIFVLGKLSHTQKEIMKEASMHSDILQDNFLDIYENLIWKSITSLLYVKQHCPNIKYVVKTDDDMLINVKRLNDTLIRFQSQSQLILGAKFDKNIVQRTGKQKVSLKQYSQSEYPEHLYGGLYILSIDAALKFANQYGSVPIIPVENVYITGILAKEMGMKLTVTNDLQFEKGESNMELSECNFIRGRLIGIHGYIMPDKVKSIWNSLLSGAPCP